jgi:hypothetical protein
LERKRKEEEECRVQSATVKKIYILSAEAAIESNNGRSNELEMNQVVASCGDLVYSERAQRGDILCQGEPLRVHEKVLHESIFPLIELSRKTIKRLGLIEYI